MINKKVEPLQDDKLIYSRNLYLKLGSDPLALMKTFFGKSFSLPFSEMHRDFSDVYMNDDIKKFVGLAPRGFGKSEEVVFGFPMHASIYHPVVSRGGVQVICSETEDTAIDRVETILEEILSNRALNAFYGNLKGKRVKARQVDIYSERMDINTKIHARGRGQQFQGLKKGHSRPYFEFFDDVESRDECDNPARVEENLKWLIRVPEQALAREGRMFYVATMMSPESMTHQVAKLKDWYSLLYSAIKSDGSMLWEEHMNSKEILQKYEAFKNVRDEQGFWLEFMNLPVNPETKELSYKHITYYEPQYLDTKTLNNYIIIDPSFSTNKGSDRTGIAVGGIDDVGNLYAHEAIYSLAKDPKSIIEEILPFIRKYKPMGIYIESFGAQRIMVEVISDLLKNEGIMVPVMGVRGETVKGAKFVRIRKLISLIKKGATIGGKKDYNGNIIPMVLFNTGSTSIKVTIRDLIMFPNKIGGGDYDVIDAFSYLEKIAVKPKVFHAKERKSDWDDMIEDIERQYGKRSVENIYKII